MGGEFLHKAGLSSIGGELVYAGLQLGTGYGALKIGSANSIIFENSGSGAAYIEVMNRLEL